MRDIEQNELMIQEELLLRDLNESNRLKLIEKQLQQELERVRLA